MAIFRIIPYLIHPNCAKIDHLFVYVCSMTVHQASQQLIFQLFHLYEEREARNIADLVMENVTEWKRVDRIVNKEVPLSPDKEKLLTRYTLELMEHKPVQYVLEEAWFCGMKFFVDENVLIPRPETEELVNWILEQSRHYLQRGQVLRLLDVGTGSGCIAVSLKKKLKEASVYACDIDEKALAVAKRNGTANNTNIGFLLCDFLLEKERNLLPTVDIIISNPPYVPFDDQQAMSPNVLQYEPHLALFVANNDPLVFYRAIVTFSQTHLAQNGAVFVEIHEEYGKAVADLFFTNGFTKVELRKDLQGRERMVRASRK